MAKFCLNVDQHREQIKANLFAFIDKLPADKAWCIEIEPLKKERTLKQNKALFGLAYVELEQQSGNEKNDLHEYFCGEFFGWVDKSVMGRVKRVPYRTTTTDHNGRYDVVETKIFANFYDFIQRRSAENGYYVSDPDPMWRVKDSQPPEVSA